MFFTHYDTFPAEFPPTVDYMAWVPVGIPTAFAGVDTISSPDLWHLQMEFFNADTMASSPAFSAVITAPGMLAGTGIVIAVPALSPSTASVVYDVHFHDPSNFTIFPETGPIAGTVTNGVLASVLMDFVIVENVIGIGTSATVTLPLPGGATYSFDFGTSAVPEPRAWLMLGALAVCAFTIRALKLRWAPSFQRKFLLMKVASPISKSPAPPSF
jgi:hypothetical protein